MNRKLLISGLALLVALTFLSGEAKAGVVKVKLYYGNFNLSGFEKMPGSWNLNAGELIITYGLDLAGAPNIANSGNWGQMGIVGIFNSDWAGARMCGFLCDWSNSGTLFPTYPDINNNLDLDDKFNMQRFPNPGSWDEAMYDVLCNGSPIGTFNPWANYGVWFDRDGVDPWQPFMWGMVNGGTYNTNGVYNVELTYKKQYPTSAYVCARFFPDLLNPLNQSDPNDDIYGIPTGFFEAGWKSTGPEKFPAGISFQTSETGMADFYVYIEGYPSPGAIIVKDLAVEGYLNLEEGMATGGGWFYAENSNNFVGNSPGGKATFGFVAKQKSGISSGNLEFQYQADKINLKSSTYDWVTLAATQVMFEGIGTINGTGSYKFRVRAVDGDKLGSGTDRFEIRIWTGGGSFDSPTYRMEGNLEGGQIVVHKK